MDETTWGDSVFVTKSRKQQWAGHIACIVVIKSEREILKRVLKNRMWVYGLFIWLGSKLAVDCFEQGGPSVSIKGKDLLPS